ncbi:MAG: 6-phosphogluconolactonase, partial [Deltaproteobacteria bacterium]|nr:6-phosphogluconolactonase [Deltaproteobacteria bacterium]
MSIYLSISKHPGGLAARCAEVLETLGHQAQERDDRFIVALSSSPTLHEVYSRWAAQSTLDWSRVIVLADQERLGSSGDGGNGGDALEESLLRSLSARPQVIRPETATEDPEQAAKAFEAQIREVLGRNGRAHVSLLDLGVDGHTAALYPGSEAVRESDRLCLPIVSPP